MVKLPRSGSELRTREAILMSVREGSMSKRDADLWAAENGETFSREPGHGRFDPMAQSEWTLSMTAAWIIGRSLDEVRGEWDDYCREKYTWVRRESVGAPSGTEFGYNLQRRETRSFHKVFGPYDRRGVADERIPASWSPRREFQFALRSGQLRATGVKRTGPGRVSFFPEDWIGRYSIVESEKDFEALCAHEDLEGARPPTGPTYRDVRVFRDDVLAVWPPLRQSFPISSADSIDRCSDSPLAQTLPPGFDRPVWTIEHILAWIACPDMARLRKLELSNPERPEWYGQIYCNGLVDKVSENALWEALITEKLVAMQRDRPITNGAWWHNKSAWSVEATWFRRDHILQFWPERGSVLVAPKHQPSAPRKNTEQMTLEEADLKRESRKTAQLENEPGLVTSTHKAIFENRPTCTILEACAETGLGKTKLYQLINCGHIQTRKIGRRTLVVVRSLLETVLQEPVLPSESSLQRSNSSNIQVRQELPASEHLKLNNAAPPSTKGAEFRAIRSLARHLKNNSDIKRDDAEQFCKAEGAMVSRRGFQQRVWPEARVLAGLDKLARPGRKRKSSR